MSRSTRLMVLIPLLLTPIPATGDDSPAPADATKTGVAKLLEDHDRALVRDLAAYARANPKAEDVERAYMVLFQRVIENDWFADHDALARSYLAERPDGAVRPLAQIVATMARARAGQFSEALASYRDLMKGLNEPSQEEFAANFADSLADTAVGAGEFGAARQVFEVLLKQFGESPALRQKVQSELERLDRVGKPVPAISVRDVDGKPFRLSEWKGKYVLVDFWATWCGPCVAELPNVKAAYERFHDRGFEIVGVSLDETPQPLSEFVRSHKMPWRQLHNASCEGDLVGAFGVTSIPATFLVGPDGTIVRLDLRGEALGKTLESLLK